MVGDKPIYPAYRRRMLEERSGDFIPDHPELGGLVVIDRDDTLAMLVKQTSQNGGMFLSEYGTDFFWFQDVLTIKGD